MSARRYRGYFDTNYDKNTALERYIRDREKVNVALFTDQQQPDPSAAACKWCHEQLILVDNGLNLLCQRCGIRTPSAKAKQQKKLVQKHGSPSGGGPSTPIIMSQDESAKTQPEGISDELHSELEEKGYHPE